MSEALKNYVHARRVERVKHYLREAEQLGRSRFPDVEADGGDAHAHGYGTSHCPYANLQAIDDAGQPCEVSEATLQKAASWMRGWLIAEEILINA